MVEGNSAVQNNEPLLGVAEEMNITRKKFFGSIWRVFHKYILFGYFSPYMRLATFEGSSAVRPEKLPDLWPSDNIGKWSEKFLAAADRNQERGSLLCSNWTLLASLAEVFKKSFIGIFFVKIGATLLSLASILLMSGFLKWQEMDANTVTVAQRTQGILDGLGILVLELVSILIGAQCSFWVQRIGLRVQGVLTAALFRHAIGSPNDANVTRENNNPKSSSYNLLVIDVPSIADFVFIIVDIIILPIRIGLSFYLLQYQVGSSAMIGLLTLIIITFCILLLEIKSGLIKTPYLHYRDVRLARCHDTVTDLRELRMAGWEDIAVSSITESREKEITYRTRRMYLDNFASAISSGAYALTQISIFGAYVYWGLQSTTPFIFKASVAIPVMQVVGRLVGPLTNLPFMINGLIEGWISAERYERHVFGEHFSTLNDVIDDLDTATTTTPTTMDEQLSTYSSQHESLPLLLSREDSFDGLNTTVYNSSPAYHLKHTTLIMTNNAVFAWRNSTTINYKKHHIYWDKILQYQTIGESGATDISVHTKSQESIISPIPNDLNISFNDPNLTVNNLTTPSIVSQQKHLGFHLILGNINVNKGECLLVVGSAGSGKSSLILALLGEMNCVYGDWLINRHLVQHISQTTSSQFHQCSMIQQQQHLCSSIGLVTQTPWIPKGTVRSIILFGRPYNKERYYRVIDICELYDDFNYWGNEKDMRWVSEGGFNLSGGQAARIALARALYHCPLSPTDHIEMNTTVCLLDDIFASIDPSVGSVIFKKLFGPNGFLKNIATILTIDETSMSYYIDGINKTDNSFLGVTLSTRHLKNGILSRYDSLHIETDSRQSLHFPDTDINEPIHDMSLCHLNRPDYYNDVLQASTKKKQSVLEQNCFIIENQEKSASGPVETKTYLWYQKFIGWKLLLLMGILILFMHLTNFSSDFWIAHWTSLSSESSSQTLKQSNLMISSNTFLQLSQEIIPEPRESLNQLSESLDNPSIRDTFKRPSVSFIEMSSSPSMDSNNHHLDDILQPDDTNRHNNVYALGIFATLSLMNIFLVIGLFTVGVFGSLRAAVSIHARLLHSIVNAPYWLYNFFPVGVILNRFSADIEVIDGGPIISMSYFFGSCIYVILIIIALCALSPWCSPLIPLVGWLVYTYVYTLYRPTCRELQRSKLIALSPLCGHLSEAEAGAITIRAFGSESYYQHMNLCYTNDLMKTQFIQIGSNNWATTRLQLLAFPFTILNSVIPMLLSFLGFSAQIGIFSHLIENQKSSQAAGFVGLAISLALGLPSSLGSVVWSISLLEQKMCSVQRVEHMISQLSKHHDRRHDSMIDDLIIQKTNNLNYDLNYLYSINKTITRLIDFPTQRVSIEIKHLYVHYPELDYETTVCCNTDKNDMNDSIQSSFILGTTPLSVSPALQNINFIGYPGEHIGIIGRTGSGKTTLFLTLLDLISPTLGEIILDTVPLQSISHSVIRQLIGILPQFPLIPKGWSIRRILDPNNEFQTNRLEKAIEGVGLTRIINDLPYGLDTPVIHDGFDFNIKEKHITSLYVKQTSDDLHLTTKYYETNHSSRQHCASRHHVPLSQLSASHIRLLTLARLSLHADTYRLVLIDEPPTQQLTTRQGQLSGLNSVDYTNDANAMQGEKGATQDINVHDKLEEDQGRFMKEIDIADILQRLFPNTIVFIVAHHASTFKHCRRVLILSHGQLKGEENNCYIQSQEELTHMIEKYKH